MNETERLDWLRLARAESVGPATFAWLIAKYRSAGAALSALPELARRGGRNHPLRIPGEAEARREHDAGLGCGATLLPSCDEGFPRLLKALDSPPPLLWARGDVSLLAKATVAIVGARAASSSGRRFARELAAGLGAAGCVIVSGLARGIDAAAHQGALETGTAAVLAGGVDELYPPENADLGRVIAERGCLVSERPPGFAARAIDFPRRNRIISGLCLGVVVVEAELRSGSLITARLAAEQGRDVFAVPGSPLDPRARGTNNLLREGAVLVEEADDVLRALRRDIEPTGQRSGLAEPGEPETLGDAAMERLAGLLSPTPARLDDLARDADVSPAAAAAALVELALAGRAELLPGGLAASVLPK